MMTIFPKHTAAQIQFNFWSLLVNLIDKFPGVRILAPYGYRIFQRSKGWLWTLAAALIAGAGLALGFLVGMLTAAMIG